MKLFIFLILVLILSCTSEKFNYRIDGSIKSEDEIKPTIWFVDTFSIKEDTLIYQNSDSSIIKINPPYKITKLK